MVFGSWKKLGGFVGEVLWLYNFDFFADEGFGLVIELDYELDIE